MSIYWNEEKQAWHWQFKATIDGERHRFSRLLPRGWSEAQARKYDEAETARTYARLSTGRRVSSIPLIDTAVALYLTERVPHLKDGKHSAQNLAHLLPFYQGRSLDQLGDISRKYAKQATNGDGEPLAPATIRQRLATLRSAASYAFEHHQLGTVDWIKQMTMPTVRNEREVFIGREDVLRVARACKDLGARALILMTFGTGSRPGECHRAESRRGMLYLGEGKNGAPILKPVPRKLRQYLRHWPMAYGYTYYAKRWREARAALGLEHVRQHDLRHSTASALLAQGKTLAQVGAVLDHKSAQSTKRYAHLALQEREAMLDEIWQKRPNTKKRA